MTKFQHKVLGAYERHERSSAIFEAAGWEKTCSPSYTWTKGDRQVRSLAHGWALVEKLPDGWPLCSEMRKGIGVLARAHGDPEELLDFV